MRVGSRNIRPRREYSPVAGGGEGKSYVRMLQEGWWLGSRNELLQASALNC